MMKFKYENGKVLYSRANGLSLVIYEGEARVNAISEVTEIRYKTSEGIMTEPYLDYHYSKDVVDIHESKHIVEEMRMSQQKYNSILGELQSILEQEITNYTLLLII